MKRQFHIFLNAIMFYTRIPVPGWMWHDEELLNKATIYFPVIGWIVGGVAFGTFKLSNVFFDENISLIISMIAGVLLTGAFHEDGFADVCDGFGGGWTKAKVLEIMKDSRLGTYGVAGLILILLLKFYTLRLIVSFDINETIFVFITAHSLSRFTAATFIFTDEYVRENEDSKAKPVAKKITFTELCIAGFFALLPLIIFVLLTRNFYLFLVILPLIFVKIFLSSFFNKKIGGYTGDCLGATQQIAEIVIYLSFIALWRFISFVIPN
jgi:adenosylcobinamide-GDP ribazoletransferase